VLEDRDFDVTVSVKTAQPILSRRLMEALARKRPATTPGNTSRSVVDVRLARLSTRGQETDSLASDLLAVPIDELQRLVDANLVGPSRRSLQMVRAV
jgi:hypothetical protein